MDYLIVNHVVESDDEPAPGTPEFNEMMGAWMSYNQKLIDGGHWIGGGSLAPSDVGTTVHKKSDGAVSFTDGPFAETKEQISGFYIISADDLDQALELAKAMPVAEGSLEVRPIAFRPDAD